MRDIIEPLLDEGIIDYDFATWLTKEVDPEEFKSIPQGFEVVIRSVNTSYPYVQILYFDEDPAQFQVWGLNTQFHEEVQHGYSEEVEITKGNRIKIGTFVATPQHNGQLHVER